MKLTSSTWYVKNCTNNFKVWNLDLLTSTQLLNKNLGFRDKELKNYKSNFKNGELATVLLKQAKVGKCKTWDLWWKIKGKVWLIAKLNSSHFVLIHKDKTYKNKLENYDRC